jgi:CBS domain-containing protein
MRATDVMASPVVAATAQITVQHVARMMINHRISGVPIVEGDQQLIGIITEGDLLRRVEAGTERQSSRWSEWLQPNSRLAADYVKSHARRVADIMTRNVVTVDEFATLSEIADLLEKHRIKRVPVVHDGKLVGIVSLADLLRILASGATLVSDEIVHRIFPPLLRG